MRSPNISLRSYKKGSRGHLEFVNLAKKNPITRLKIHPPDKRTPYHIHIYEKCGNSLHSNLNIVDRSSAAAHIKYRGEM